jgi:hypothetical protein
MSRLLFNPLQQQQNSPEFFSDERLRPWIYDQQRHDKVRGSAFLRTMEICDARFAVQYLTAVDRLEKLLALGSPVKEDHVRSFPLDPLRPSDSILSS